VANGADTSGDEMVVGRTNESENRTLLVAKNGDDAPGGYDDDFVLQVSTENDHVLRSVPEGVDALHANGTKDVPGFPAGNGAVATGLNGLVGYVHAASRDKAQEGDVQAGVLGQGSASNPGLFGRGVTGVVGYEQATGRNQAWELGEQAGVAGRGPTGVSGFGDNAGVHGTSHNAGDGVRGETDLGSGVNGASSSGAGVQGNSTDGPGVTGRSVTDRGGVFESHRSAQLRLFPQDMGATNPPGPVTGTAIPAQEAGPALPHDGKGGDLAVLRDPTGMCTLWFCVGEFPPPAMWAQVLLGPVTVGKK
jgi:hypothetical protein